MALRVADILISVDDYLEGELVSDVRHEYTAGVVHSMAGGTVRHNRACGNVFLGLGNALGDKPCQPYNSDTKVKVELAGDVRFYYPDVQVVCDSTDDDCTYQERPVVVVEVLSESTRRVDLGEKRTAYLQLPTLKVLITVDPDEVLVRVDRRDPNGGFKMEVYNELEQVIELPEIDAELTLSAIYRGLSM